MKQNIEEIKKRFRGKYVTFSQGAVEWWESDCVIKFIQEREPQIRREAVEGFVELFVIRMSTWDIVGFDKQVATEAVREQAQSYLAQTEEDLVNKEDE